MHLRNLQCHSFQQINIPYQFILTKTQVKKIKTTQIYYDDTIIGLPLRVHI